jgi:transcriptional regulator with XRE-family HTH domain
MPGTTYPKRQGGLLRLARSERGLTAQEVAERAGVSPSRISQVERAEIDGTLQLDTLDRFAAALGYRLRYELVHADEHAAMLASESVGGPYRVSPPSEARSLSGLESMIADGRATPARLRIRDLPPPVQLSDAERAALGGRTVSEMLIAERDADPR